MSDNKSLPYKVFLDNKHIFSRYGSGHHVSISIEGDIIGNSKDKEVLEEDSINAVGYNRFIIFTID